MSKCKFIDKCTHATGWCNSERTWKTCEYVSVNNFNEHFKIDICNTTKSPCSYCNPVCEHRIIRKDDLMVEKIKAYKCEICGTPHDSITARANCELTCYQKQVEAEEKAKWEKMLKEKEDRKNQILQKRKELADLEQDFYEDYRDYPVSNTITIKPIRMDKEDFEKYFKDVFGKFYW